MIRPAGKGMAAGVMAGGVAGIGLLRGAGGGGARRGEACGYRWAGSDLDAGYLAIERPILIVGAAVVEGEPKSDESKRRTWLDGATLALLRAHHAAQMRARLQAGPDWQDHDLVFCQPDGRP